LPFFHFTQRREARQVLALLSTPGRARFGVKRTLPPVMLSRPLPAQCDGPGTLAPSPDREGGDTRVLKMEFFASLAPPMRRSVCQHQNQLRFHLRKVFIFFRLARQPARLPSALFVDLRSGAHWGSSWFWVLLSLRRSHRWTQALNRSHPNSACCFASPSDPTFPRTFTRRWLVWPGCATARILLRSPTADATAPPVSWPPPPRPASSHSCRRARIALIPTVSNPYPARTDR
jgi:hypothetical protein